MQASQTTMETLKRKYADHSDISYYPKRIRTDSNIAPICDNSFPVNSDEVSIPQPLQEIDMVDDIFPQPSTDYSSNDRAIVLYKPSNPDLLVENSIPRAPSVHMGRWIFNNELLPPNPVQQLGKPSQLVSNSSTDNTLAIIPWVPNTVMSGLSFLNSENESGSPCEPGNKDDEMIADSLESDKMEEDNLNIIDSTQNGFPTGEPWQYYSMPQPLMGSLMRSR